MLSRTISKLVCGVMVFAGTIGMAPSAFADAAPKSAPASTTSTKHGKKHASAKHTKAKSGKNARHAKASKKNHNKKTVKAKSTKVSSAAKRSA